MNEFDEDQNKGEKTNEKVIAVGCEGNKNESQIDRVGGGDLRYN